MRRKNVIIVLFAASFLGLIASLGFSSNPGGCEPNTTCLVGETPVAVHCLSGNCDNSNEDGGYCVRCVK